MDISRHSLIFGLSYALDIAGKNNLSHSKSVAYLTVKLAREMRMSEDESLAVYYAALLHDIGIGDEYILGIRYDTDIKKHCIIGEQILKKIPLPDEIPTMVLYHHEYYNGHGPFGLSGDTIPKGSQIICFASAFDDLFCKAAYFDKNLYLDICNWAEKNKPLFSEEIIDAFRRIIKREYVLFDYFNHETKYTLSDKIIVGDTVRYDYEDVKKIALCFADIIDQRSPFTYYHSTGIADLAKKAAGHLGYGDEVQEKMYIAGLLHDIGKLHVPADILHKNGKLEPDERFEINKHAYYTRKILEQVQGFDEIVELASNHHEKLDGTGYPYGKGAVHLSELERVMAICDVYQALTEDRPYRPKLPQEQVWGMIFQMAENMHLDMQLALKIKQAV